MAFRATMKEWLGDLISLVFPRLCEVCDRRLVRGENLICIECDYNLPRCNIHTDPFNEIHKRLLRHIHIEKAASYFYYTRGSRYTNLILSAKYRSRPKIARELAHSFAREIIESGFFDDIDTIVPVPISHRKEISRGYNQAAHIALGIADLTNIPVIDTLSARSHSTQTRKSASQRWMNARGIYDIKSPQLLEGKHILLVDDVITTGATISACCEAIQNNVKDIRISILTLAATL